MSGIAGILQRDGAPVDSAALARMVAVLARHGVDRHAVEIRGQIGLGHALLATTPEAAHEYQPVSLAGQVWLTADVRLDNRADLLRSLTAHGQVIDPACADPELILRAYAVWGDDFVRHLIGDFAFALWDEGRRRLLCARDPLGIRPLYYLEQPHQLIFSSEIRAILAALDQPLPLNEAYMLDFLAGSDQTWALETVYRGIFPVKPTHLLSVDPHIRQQVYYDWDAVPDTRYKTDDEYIEHFRALYQQVLLDHTRSATPVAVEVSGGLDSSANAAMLKHLEESGRLDGRTIVPYSLYSERFPNINVRKYLDQIIERCQPWDFHLINPDSLWGLKDRNLPQLCDQPALTSLVALELNAMQQARALGCRVVLSGTGGDELLLGEGYYVPELFAIIPTRRWRSEWAQFRRTAGRKQTLFYGVMVHAVRRLISLRGICTLDRLMPGVWLSHRRGMTPDWIDAAAPSCKSQLEFNSKFMFSRAKIRLLLKSILSSGLEQTALVQMGWLAQAAGVERRHPYLDRRMVDFAMSLPGDYILRGGQDRWLLRQAVRGILPEAIRSRPSSGTYQPLVELGWKDIERSAIESAIADSVICQRGWVRHDQLRAAWSQYLAGQVVEHLWAFNAWLNAELWIREWQG